MPTFGANGHLGGCGFARGPMPGCAISEPNLTRHRRRAHEHARTWSSTFGQPSRGAGVGSVRGPDRHRATYTDVWITTGD